MAIPKPDLVIEFATSLKPGSAPRAQKAEELLSQYQRLLTKLSTAGLVTTSRGGRAGSDTILIFIRVKKSRIQAEYERESLNDVLHGIISPASASTAPTNQISSAVRLRLAYAILTSKPSSNSLPIYLGLNLVPNNVDFPRVLSIFAPHDNVFNQRWKDLWNDRKRAVSSIPLEELTEIKDHHGEAVALYFAFLRFYFSALVFPASGGFLFWLFGFKFSPIYSVLLVLWAIIFLEAWSLKERELSVLWGTRGIALVETPRAEFRGVSQVDPVSGESVEIFPWHLTLLRQLATIPLLLLCLVGLVGLICFSYTIEVLVQEVYSGPGKMYFSLLPTILVAGLVPQVLMLWTKLAERLTKWENHSLQSAHERSFAFKVFALHFFVAFLSLILTAYIYIPFGSVIVPRILAILPGHSSLQAATIAFSINSTKLTKLLMAYTLTGQITGGLAQLGVPIMVGFLNREVTKVIEKRHPSKESVVDFEDEAQFLDRIREEATLPEFSLFTEYSQMILQWGYLIQFSTIWPIAPVWSFLNNFLELRSDAFRLTALSRRPIPIRASTIGPGWVEILGFLTFFGVLTNASLTYLYQPRALSSFSTPTAFNSTSQITTMTNLFDASHRATPQDPHSLSSIRSTLLTSLLIALAVEHIFRAARWAVRYLLWRAMWKGSEAEIRLKRAELALRLRRFEKFEKEGAKLLGEGADADPEFGNEFWKRQDQGLDLIRSRSKED